VRGPTADRNYENVGVLATSNEWIGFMTTSQTCTVSSGSLTGYDAGGSSPSSRRMSRLFALWQVELTRAVGPDAGAGANQTPQTIAGPGCSRPDKRLQG
jgi:hypothetical protein